MTDSHKGKKAGNTGSEAPAFPKSTDGARQSEYTQTVPSVEDNEVMAIAFSFDAKLRQARYHAKKLGEILQQMSAEGNAVIVDERHPDPTHLQLRVVKVPEIDLVQLRLSLGDCFHNLRCALDHLAFSLVAANNGMSWITERPEVRSSIKFYIERDPEADQVNEKKFRATTRHMAEEAVTLLREAKAFRRGNWELWLLNELNNIDKHQFIPVSGIVGGWKEKNAHPDSISYPGLLTSRVWITGEVPMTTPMRPVKNGSMFLKTGLDPVREANPTLFLDVTMHEEGIVHNQPVRVLIAELGGRTESVISTFRPYLERRWEEFVNRSVQETLAPGRLRQVFLGTDDKRHQDQSSDLS